MLTSLHPWLTDISWACRNTDVSTRTANGVVLTAKRYGPNGNERGADRRAIKCGSIPITSGPSAIAERNRPVLLQESRSGANDGWSVLGAVGQFAKQTASSVIQRAVIA